MMHPTFSRHLSLVLVSAALLAFQIALLQILAASQWHHFAYMVISIALLGFGVAGTLLSLSRDWMVKHQNHGLPIMLAACAITLAGAIAGIHSLVGGFDSYLLFVNPTESLRLALTALLLMLPFTFGALVIGIVFSTETERIGSYYFANLLGSGLGCILGLLGLSMLSADQLPPLCGLVCVLASILLARWDQRHVISWVLVALVSVIWLSIYPPTLPMSQYKDLNRVLNLPGAKVVAEQPSIYGKIEIVDAEALRSADGLSLNWQNKLPASAAAFVNGDMFGSLPTSPGPNNPQNGTTAASAFAIGKPQRVLILNAGTGQNITLALERSIKHIVAVEPNRQMVELLAKESLGQDGTVYSDDRVSWVHTSARTWLARSSTHFDLIILPTIGSFGGNAGLFALHEQPLYTTDALQHAWQALSPDGFLSLSTWVDYPVRNPIRILATLVELLESKGLNPVEHIAAIRSWGMITFCIKKTALTAGETDRIRIFAKQWAFDPLLLPTIRQTERQLFNALQDDTLLTLVDKVYDQDQRTRLYQDYPFRVTPTDDDQPFFTQFLRWSHIRQLLDQFGQRSVPFIELGIVVAGLSALVLSTLAVVLILLPLTKLRAGPGSPRQTLTYFGCLGIGYIWFELAMIHRFETYLGQPIYSASLVIAILLIGSAIGSAVSARLKDHHALQATRMVSIAFCLYALVLGPVLQSTLQLELSLRVFWAIVLLLPAAFLMGIPFPLGLRFINREHAAKVPWAWGINGCLSVVGAVIATLIAVEVGYSTLLLLAAAAYLLPSLHWRTFSRGTP